MKSDPELMAALAAGDEGAFEVLVERHRQGLVNFFHRLVWEHALAEGLAQDVFLKLYLHKEEYTPQAKFTTYLYRIARNCWIDHLRRTKSERKNRSLDAETDEGKSLGVALQVKAEDPGATVKKDELADAVVEAIDELPEEHKIVFILSEVKGMRYQEISETLEIPVGTVKSRMFHAVQRLRKSLARLLKDTTGPWQTLDEAAEKA